MKNRINLPTLLIVAAWSCLLGCSSPAATEKKAAQPQPIETVAVLQKKYLKLDSLTPPNLPYVQYLPSSRELLALNRSIHALEVYHWPSGERKNRYILPKEGAGSIGLVKAFYHQSADSVWMVSGSHIGLATLTEAAVELSPQFRLETSASPGMPYFNGMMPLGKIDGQFLMANILPGSTQHAPLRLISSEGQNRFKLNVPTKYQKGEWGAMNYDFMPFAFSPVNKIVVAGFAAAEEVMVYEVPTDVVAYKRLATDLIAEVPPLYESRAEVPQDSDVYTQDFLKAPSYWGIYYDPFRNVYYRLFRVGSPESEWNKPIWDWQSDFTVIVADSALNKMGEYQLPRATYLLGMIFPVEEGLAIGVKSENEDQIEFQIFNFTEK